MSDHEAALALRAKILGVLIKEARLAERKTTQECAAAIGCATAVYKAYEAGAKSPSLPELELLAYFLDVPLAHFGSDRSLAETQPPPPAATAITILRDRLIGARLRQARTAARLKSQAFAASLGFSAARLNAYEKGGKPIPLPLLEAWLPRVGLTLDDVLDTQGRIGEWENARRLEERLRALPPELREFILQPGNETYLRLAQRLSQMPTQQLRDFAAGLLEITF